MFYLIFGVFLIVFNILPFVACRCCIHWMAATVQPTGMGTLFVGLRRNVFDKFYVMTNELITDIQA